MSHSGACLCHSAVYTPAARLPSSLIQEVIQRRLVLAVDILRLRSAPPVLDALLLIICASCGMPVRDLPDFDKRLRPHSLLQSMQRAGAQALLQLSTSSLSVKPQHHRPKW